MTDILHYILLKGGSSFTHQALIVMKIVLLLVTRQRASEDVLKLNESNSFMLMYSVLIFCCHDRRGSSFRLLIPEGRMKHYVV